MLTTKLFLVYQSRGSLCPVHVLWEQLPPTPN